MRGGGGWHPIHIHTAQHKHGPHHLQPHSQAMAAAGVPDGACVLTDKGMEQLIDAHCREAGVRNLKKLLEKIYRKVALKLVRKGHLSAKAAGTEDDEATGPGGAAAASAPLAESLEPSVIDDTTLAEYVGQAPFSDDRLYDVTPPGVVMGLAWTAMGGSTLYIEAASMQPGKAAARGGGARMRSTGQLGDVMKESTAIAHTYARHLMQARCYRAITRADVGDNVNTLWLGAML